MIWRAWRRLAGKPGQLGLLAIGIDIDAAQRQLVAGHLFPTPSHAGAPGRGVAFLRAVAAAVKIPVQAVGGLVGLGAQRLGEAAYTPYEKLDEKAVARVDEAVEFADRSMEAVCYYAYWASTEMAEERGRYSSYKGSLWDRGIMPQDTLKLLAEERGGYVEIDDSSAMDWDALRARVKKHGMRNSNCVAIAPTATISNVIGVAASIEPEYQNIYVKSNLSGEFTVVNEHLVAELKRQNLWDEVMVSDLKYFDGSLARIDRVPADLRLIKAKGLLTDYAGEFEEMDQLGMVRFVSTLAVETVIETADFGVGTVGAVVFSGRDGAARHVRRVPRRIAGHPELALPAAAIGHVQHVDAGPVLERLAGNDARGIAAGERQLLGAAVARDHVTGGRRHAPDRVELRIEDPHAREVRNEGRPRDVGPDQVALDGILAYEAERDSETPVS